MSTTLNARKMVKIPMSNRSHARHELNMKLMKLREEFHDVSKKIYESAGRDVKELERRMEADSKALEEEFQKEFSVNHETGAQMGGDLFVTGLEKANNVNNSEAKSETTVNERAEIMAANGQNNHERGGRSISGPLDNESGSNATDAAAAAASSDEIHTGEVHTPVDTTATTDINRDGPIYDREASTEILSPFTPSSEAQVHLTTKRRHEHTGSSSSLSPPPEDFDTQRSTPSKVRNRKQRKSSTGAALKIGSRTSRFEKPENNSRAGHDEIIGFSWSVSMIGWDPAGGTSELPVTWRRDISLKMKHPDFSSFEPYIGVENRGKLFPKMVLNDEWDGIAFYDKSSRRFEVFKKNRERLRIQFEDTKYWGFGENRNIGGQEVPSFVTAFQAELGLKITVEQSYRLGEDADFMTEGAGSHTDHLVRLQEL